MSAGLIHAESPAPAAVADGRATLLALARADARRYVRHPLFVLPCAVVLVMVVASVVQRDGGGTDPMFGTMMIAFFFGVFGFLVAHRLTNSMLRTRELAGVLPVGRQVRTLSLCLACLVSAAAGTATVGFMLVTAAFWPPDGEPSSLPVAWFGDYPASTVLPALIAMGPVAALGGPLLGVVVARWMPFRGSGLLGVVVLVVATAIPASDSRGSDIRLASAWPVLMDEHVDPDTEQIISTTFVPGITPGWALGWVLCLCGLAVVAALLRDPQHRRPLLFAGAGLTLAAAACYALALA
ncbi:hypothetical protein EKO23_19865 [Nocardioides guangzhouensis]|uniref:Uncharacterized protein n=1 Tax=Nocardioides guangzhouensis TaxID=2497878 RepID=A0A4V1XYG7_9ACTN|nr:hypothetical protein [Nocardioides guangzhouensis]RYP83189.1 hypothetical protein EKO23_19865 [Nocardioides guangzhouensis]